eukprot:SAG11_NODE_5616_length_1507_cov_1.727273_1_plen_121_part_10
MITVAEGQADGGGGGDGGGVDDVAGIADAELQQNYYQAPSRLPPRPVHAPCPRATPNAAPALEPCAAWGGGAQVPEFAAGWSAEAQQEIQSEKVEERRQVWRLYIALPWCIARSREVARCS